MTESVGARLPAHLRLPTSPVVAPANVIRGEHWRISVLDAGLVRLEWSPSGTFEDRASQAVLHRDFPAVDFSVVSNERVTEIVTQRLHLTYDRQAFTGHGLSVQARGGISSYHSTWRFGMPTEGNLGGTARTLDNVDGRAPLGDGVLSQHGIASYDDSRTVLLTGDGGFAAREPGSIDVYVFAYGRDYPAALDALYRLTGSPPLLPRWALGNWWSRYHPYTDTEYLGLLDRFAQDRLPFSVAVLDMDWHLVDIDRRYGSGWTGYTWNRALFADPASFLGHLHERGLKVTLNVHPADGIRAHEDAYPQVAAAMGVDPQSQLPVAFDPTDPRFLASYFADVHHRLEDEGVDFWWIDWQQGEQSRIAGLDPLWLLNHLHYLDAARPGARHAHRPLVLSRYAGVGSHRYPVGFSGDTVVSWASLAFQAEFTARADGVGYGWWSHDIGGHMFGVKDDELATRWVQLGVFSPILRLHSTNDVFNSKEPWRFSVPAQQIMGRFLRLRHQLVPYLATMARRASTQHRPLVEPMYFDHPWVPDAYEVPGQFSFGTSLLVAPVVAPADRRTGLGRVEVWLPPGDWVDLFTGVAYRGGRRVPMHRDLSSIPVLARPGTVLPLVPASEVSNQTGPPSSIQVWVVAGGEGSFALVEDNDDDAWATTPLTVRDGLVRIGPVTGAVGSVPAERDWELVYVGVEPAEVSATDRAGQELAVQAGPIPGSVSIPLGRHPSSSAVEVTLHGDQSLRGADVRRHIFGLLDRAQVEFTTKARVWDAVQRAGSPADAALELHSLDVEPALLSAVSELLLARR